MRTADEAVKDWTAQVHRMQELREELALCGLLTKFYWLELNIIGLHHNREKAVLVAPVQPRTTTPVAASGSPRAVLDLLLKPAPPSVPAGMGPVMIFMGHERHLVPEILDGAYERIMRLSVGRWFRGEVVTEVVRRYRPDVKYPWPVAKLYLEFFLRSGLIVKNGRINQTLRFKRVRGKDRTTQTPEPTTAERYEQERKLTNDLRG